VAQKEETRKDDERLKEELKNADLEKFKKVVKRVLAPAKKQTTK